ncbi:hypothetical protein BsWGS_19653 [Bradybaena similaris]
MHTSTTRRHLVFLLLAVYQVLVEMSSSDRQQPPLTTVHNHNDAVGEKGSANEEDDVARLVENHNFTHTAKHVTTHNLTHKARDVTNHNLTHTVGVHTGSQDPDLASDYDTYYSSVPRGRGHAAELVEHHNPAMELVEHQTSTMSGIASFNSTWGNVTDVTQGAKTVGNSSHGGPNITLQTTTTHMHLRESERLKPLPNDKSPSLQGHVSLTQVQHGANPVGKVKTTIKDWFLEFAKRINSPAWLLRRLDASGDSSQNHTHQLSDLSSSAFNSSKADLSDYNSTTISDSDWAWPHRAGLQSGMQNGSSISGNADWRSSKFTQHNSPVHSPDNSPDHSPEDTIDELQHTGSIQQARSHSGVNLSDHERMAVTDNSKTRANFNGTAASISKPLEYLNSSNNSSECPSCMRQELAEERIKAIRLKMFKNLLVQKLRWDHDSLSDNSERKLELNIPIIPESLVEQTLRDNAREYRRDEFHARDQEVIIAGEDMGRDCIKLHVTGCYSFRLKGRVREKVAQAQIWVYKMEDASDQAGQTFSLYELERLKSGRLIHSSMIASVDTLTKQGWVVLNVTQSLVKWVDKRKGSRLVAVRCVTCVTRGHRALYGAKHGYTPLLVITYVTDARLMRGKRSTSCDPRYECCKRELMVNFQEIGMSDILQPRDLSVGYCFGECNENQNYVSNHTVIRQQVRGSEPLANEHSLKQQLKPCCVPAILKDIFIMTSDGDGSIVRKLLPKVVVETCGCM